MRGNSDLRQAPREDVSFAMPGDEEQGHSPNAPTMCQKVIVFRVTL